MQKNRKIKLIFHIVIGFSVLVDLSITSYGIYLGRYLLSLIALISAVALIVGFFYEG